MEMIGSYEQLTPFTNENAGTSEWCRAQKDGRPYFIKKFLKRKAKKRRRFKNALRLWKGCNLLGLSRLI